MKERKFEEPLCYIDPLSDFGFKRMFAADGCQEELKYLLNLFISERLGTISEVEYLPNDAVGLESDETKVVFDVLCKNQDNDYYVVEMQRIRQRFPIQRGIAYASRLISNSLTIDNKKYKVSKVCVVCIMEQPDRLALRRNEKVWFVNFKDDFGNIISDNPTFCIIELGIFARENIVPKTEQELFMHVLKNMTKMMELPESVSGKPFFEAMFKRCNYKVFSDMEKKEYEKSIWDDPYVQSGMELVREEAFLDGLEQGEAKGKAEGRAEGRAEGKTEGIAEGEAKGKAEIARNLLLMGLDIQTIVKATGLSEKEMLKLRS